MMLAKASETLQHAFAHPVIGGEPIAQQTAIPRFGFGKRHDAPGHAPPFQRARLRPARIYDNQLGRSAANIENQRRPVAHFQQAMAANHRQPRLFLWRDNIEPDTSFPPHAISKLGAICRTPACLGRDRTREMDAAPMLRWILAPTIAGC